MKIKQTLAPHGPATAIVLSDAQVAALGGGKRAAVTVTIAGKTARLRLAVMGGQNLIGISKANRAELGVAIGDTIVATIALDGAARTVSLPDDAAKALAKAKLRARFDALAFTHQKEHVRAIEDAKKPETRARRIAAMLDKLRAG
ncbi:MAG TPA: YdeI/OmpD-associated family protein [Kofleriaceae bacterium]|nr:YdeI/OmpD-associated family protein [Kofleriaceae bacterium]